MYNFIIYLIYIFQFQNPQVFNLMESINTKSNLH